MKFKLHPRLAKVLGMATETRPKIIEALWQYIKTHKLQVSIGTLGIIIERWLLSHFTVSFKGKSKRKVNGLWLEDLELVLSVPAFR